MLFPTMWYVRPAMIVKLLTEHHLEFLSLKGGCRGLSESTLVKMSNCWKSYVTAQISFTLLLSSLFSSIANFGSKPAIVGRKNGAALGAFGGSLGLFLC